MGHDNPDQGITRDQIRAWSSADLTKDQLDRIVDAIPNSSIPDAVAEIAFTVLDGTGNNR